MGKRDLVLLLPLASQNSSTLTASIPWRDRQRLCLGSQADERASVRNRKQQESKVLVAEYIKQKWLISSDFLSSSSVSHVSSYTCILPCPLPRVWKNPGGLAWGDILPGWWLPALWGCSLGHSTKGQSRKASREANAASQRGSQETPCSSRGRKDPGCPSPKVSGLKQSGKRPLPQKLAGWASVERKNIHYIGQLILPILFF